MQQSPQGFASKTYFWRRRWRNPVAQQCGNTQAKDTSYGHRHVKTRRPDSAW